MTHSANENSKKGNSFQTQSYGLNATINALNNPGLNHPLHSYYSPKPQPRLIQTTSRQQVTNLTLQGGNNQASHDKQPPNSLIGQYKYSHI